MSGIAGIVLERERTVETGELRRMTARLAHRGPDASGHWSHGFVGLGHTLLSTTAEDAGSKLPLHRERSDVVITADARIDNRRELLRVLGLGTSRGNQISDAELVLCAYEAWGVGCPEWLLGDFAFAIWDRRRGRLFAARDPIGARPFCFHASLGLFAFASEVPALLALESVPRTLDETRIADTMLPGLEASDKTRTFFAAIRRLPPASRLVVSEGGVRIDRYWRLDPSREIRRRSGHDYVEEFRALFSEAVRARLRSAGQTGSMLSGGVDSSAIVGAASRQLLKSGRGPLHTFSVRLADDPCCGDSNAIRRMLTLPGLQAHTVEANRLDSFTEELSQHPHGAEDPFDASMTLTRLTYLAARRAGVRVVLDGVDGDYVTSHEPDALSCLARGGAWRELWEESVGLAGFYRGYHAPWSSPWRLLGRSLRGALTPPPLRRAVRALRRDSRARNAVDASIIRRDFARRVGLSDRLDRLHPPQRPATMREHQAAQLDHPNLAVALERYDRVAAACAIEPRHPFLDRRLVEYCLAIPWDQKLRHGWTKWIVRRAIAGTIPHDVAWRRGRWEGLGPACTSVLMQSQRERLDAFVTDQLDALDSWLDIGVVREAYGSYLDSGDRLAGEKVWQAATLGWWVQQQTAAAAAGSSV